jgi:hypothetical protein
MSLSLYDITVPVFIRALDNLSEILKKGRAFADEQGLPHADLLEARLFHDMAPLTAQIQRASDASRFTVKRISGRDIPEMPDTETSFDELEARIAATIAFLKTVPAESMNGREGAPVEVKTPNVTLQFTGRSFVLDFVIPNFFFHVTTAYALLRHKGVPIGKRDYIGPTQTA